MPELPEVETYRRYLEETCLFQTIRDLEVEHPRMLATDYDSLRQALVGSQFVGTHRIGKNLFLPTDQGPVLVLHFGMTGGVAYYRDDEDQPRFARVVFGFSNGFKLAFVDSRMFGRVMLTESVVAYQQQKGLGPDALSISVETLQATLHKKKAPIKPLLLDQKITAGIGNWIADEVLFQAHIHPERRASDLSAAEYQQLHQAIRLVLKTAIAAEAVYRDFPREFLIHAREWDEVPSPGTEEHRRCPRCGTVIEKTRVGGRATYSCRQCQVI
jgi:formamidopyrimidine-DNA glycosylase